MKWRVSEAVGIVDVGAEAVLHQQLHRLQGVLCSLLTLYKIGKRAREQIVGILTFRYKMHVRTYVPNCYYFSCQTGTGCK